MVMRVATIDIGTNSVLLLIAEANDGALVPQVERATVTRLGEGVDRTRRLAPEASARTLACLEVYAREIAARDVSRVDVVGTSALRDAEGGQLFCARARALLGVTPRVIDGEEEARLTFIGALSGLSVSGLVTVFDIGGGSTEIVSGQLDSTAHVQSAVSLDVGCVRLSERHVHHDPPTPAEMQAVKADLSAAFAALPPFDPTSTLVGVAGTVTQLSAVEHGISPYDPSRVHGSVLTRDAVERLAARLAALPLSERRALHGMEPARADVLVVGGAITQAVLSWSQSSQLLVSDRGVRWGLATELARTSGT